MQLYGYFRSSCAYRVRIALNLKQIECEMQAVNLVAGEQREAGYLEKNPQGLVPALVLDNGEVITQSTAILEWLEECYPGVPLFPKDRLERARCRSLCNLIACDIHPLDNLRVLKYLVNELGATEAQKLDWYRHWIAQGFTALEPQLQPAPFAMGAAPGMVEVYLVPQVYNALRFNQDMSAFPRIMALYETCNPLPAFQAAAPEAQADAR